MKRFQKTPLENWIAQKIGLPEEASLTPEALTRYQVCKLNATIAFAYCNSPFYHEYFGGRMPVTLERRENLQRLPSPPQMISAGIPTDFYASPRTMSSGW